MNNSQTLIPFLTQAKKLIRSGIAKAIVSKNNGAASGPHGNIERISNLDELNKLYYLKVLEELEEIKASDCLDPLEFVDLFQVVFSWAQSNGFTKEALFNKMVEKSEEAGIHRDHVLILDETERAKSSNKIYFQNTLNY